MDLKAVKGIKKIATKKIELSKDKTFVINKSANYLDHKIILSGIDEKRVTEFNQCKTIEVTEQELKAIGLHRWLEVKQNVS